MATTTRKDLPIWARSRPSRIGATQPLTAAQKRTAKVRAAAAGRKYPNLIDNIAAARNPTMKPASPAQIAARKRFAEMARSGAFKKTAKRKANPATIQYIVFSELSPQKYKQMLVTENKQRAISVADVNQMDGYHSVVEDQVGHLIYDAKTRKGYLQSNPSKRKANPADIHLAGNYYGKVSKDGTGSFWTYVVNRIKEVNPDGSLYETEDVVGDFKAKYYATMKGALNALDKYKAKLSGIKRNPAKKTVSQKISQLVHEGYPQRQAVAVALSEQRAGKVKRNPMGEIQAYAITRNFKVLGIFQTKQDAIKAAQGISDATGKTLAIKPVQVMAGHFNK